MSQNKLDRGGLDEEIAIQSEETNLQLQCVQLEGRRRNAAEARGTVLELAMGGTAQRPWVARRWGPALAAASFRLSVHRLTFYFFL